MKPSSSILRAVVFDGGWNLPIWAAQRQGYFEAHGIRLDLFYTASSASLVSGLFDGRYDIALAGADNFIAYQEGAGEADIAGDADLFMFMGGDGGFLSLVCASDVQDVAGLRGRRIAVDAMTTGFAFVLRELLAREGLAETEVTFERAGGTGNRYQALVAGRHDATLLRTPFDLLAVERCFRQLASAQVLGPYQGTVGGARRSWAQANRAVLVDFLRAYRDGLQWCLDGGNRPIVEALLLAHLKDMTPACAPVAAGQLLAPGGGLARDMRVDTAGLRTVLGLRRKYAPAPTAGATQDMYDPAFLDEAART